MPEPTQLHYLIVSAIAPNHKGIANKLSDIIYACGCNIVEGKMQTMGNSFTAVFQVAGGWNAVAKLEHQLPTRASQLHMTTMTRRAEDDDNSQTELPYLVDIITRDNPGISQQITLFFSDRGINIDSMNLDTYPAQHTGAQVGEIRMIVLIPDEFKIAELRDQFANFCNQHNLDASLEAFTR